MCVLLSLPYPRAGLLAGQAPDPHAEVVEEASPVIGTGPWRGRVPVGTQEETASQSPAKPRSDRALCPGDGP